MKLLKYITLKRQFLLLPLLPICILFINCRGAGGYTPSQKQVAESYLLFQKTPCLGTCPSYEASIYTDGKIRFVGWEHVPLTDTLYLHLPAKDMAALRKQVEKLEFNTLQETYLTQWSDMPSTIIAFYRNGKPLKRIKHEEGGPQRLRQFQEYLHTTIMKLVEAERIKRLPRE